MSIGTQDLRDFHQFIGEKLSNGAGSLSPEDALQEWRELKPEPATDEDVAAIQEALDDMANGDKGRPLEDVLTEIRAKFGIPSPS